MYKYNSLPVTRLLVTFSAHSIGSGVRLDHYAILQ